MGGRSAEREISLLSGNAVLAALKRKGVDAHAFDTRDRDLHELAHHRDSTACSSRCMDATAKTARSRARSS